MAKVEGEVRITLSFEAAAELKKVLDFPQQAAEDWEADGMPSELEDVLVQLP